jgi:DNA repair exonuclease SbcCD ATPase subunit
VEPEIVRLQRDVEALAVRLRSVENIDTPRQKELVSELHELRTKVSVMDIEGTAITRERIGRIQDSILRVDQKLDEFKEAVDDRFDKIDEYQTAVRTTIRGALVTAAFSIAVSIITGVLLYVLLSGKS